MREREGKGEMEEEEVRGKGIKEGRQSKDRKINREGRKLVEFITKGMKYF